MANGIDGKNGTKRDGPRRCSALRADGDVLTTGLKRAVPEAGAREDFEDGFLTNGPNKRIN
jgi:hypothetical protein